MEFYEKSKFCLEDLISNFKDLNSSLVLIDGVQEKNSSYELSMKIFNELHYQHMIDARKAFFLWCEFQDEMSFRLISGEKIYGINNCFKHKLLSEHKISGIFFVYVSEKYAQNLDLVKNLISEIEASFNNTFFFVLSNDDVIDLILSEAPYCKIFAYDHYAELFGDVWEKIDEENKKAIRNLKEKLLKESVLSALRKEIAVKPELDINIVLNTLIKRATYKRRVIGFGE